MSRRIADMSLKEYIEMTRVEGLADFEISIIETYIELKLKEQELSFNKSYITMRELTDVEKESLSRAVSEGIQTCEKKSPITRGMTNSAMMNY